MIVIRNGDELNSFLTKSESYWFLIGAERPSFSVIYSSEKWAFINFSHIDFPIFDGNVEEFLPKTHTYFVHNMGVWDVFKGYNAYDMASSEWYICNESQYSTLLKDNIQKFVRRYDVHNFIYDIVHPMPIYAMVKKDGINIINVIGDISTQYPLHSEYTKEIFWTLADLSKAGLCIYEDGKHIKPILNINNTTKTGRPTIAYDRHTLTNMRKDNDDRAMVVSCNGHLVEFDYRACHVYIIAHMIGYSFNGEDPYHHIAKEYYGVDDITDILYNDIKKKTFRALYGDYAGDDKMRNIEFFVKTKSAATVLYNTFLNTGYIQTPLGRTISSVIHTDMNPNKLLSYYILSVETEKNISVLRKVQNYLLNRKSNVVLYLYDSYLIDMSEDDIKDINDIKTIIEEDGFPCKIKTGKSFHRMEELNCNN